MQGAHLAGTLHDPVTVVAPAAEYLSAAPHNTPLSLVTAEGDSDPGASDDSTLLDGDPVFFGDGTLAALVDAPNATHGLARRTQRRFLGDDTLILASGWAWPICLANRA